ncbi:MAG: thioredoxin family protein [Bacteroidales bacterium]|jgi:thiol:disulfide interchange protein DsbD|nr:thioredoxin family protein [Bacteroidales bacterium]
MNKQTRIGKSLLLVMLGGLILCGYSLKAQIVEPVKWSYTSQYQKDNIVLLKITATVDKGWHLYSQYNTLGITQATVFTFEPSEKYKTVGKPAEPKYTEFTDEFGTDRYFEGSTVVFTQKTEVFSDKDFVIKGTVEAQACIEGKCIMVGTDFEIPVQGISPDKLPDKKQKQDADSSVSATDTTFSDTIPTITEEQANTVDNENPADEAKQGGGMSKQMVFLISLLAGLAALLTPCVFPMIPLTISFFMKGNSRKKGVKIALFFGSSIVIIFAILGVVLTLLFGENATYILSTHWIPNLFFFVIFLIFALSFFGLFEITLPSSWANKSDAQSEKGGWAGTFFVALTTVLVSFSCTGPIIGGVIIGVAADSMDRITPLISMLGFALGFAAPFTLLALFPSVMAKMKAGSWMNSVKIVFGFLELALGLKFLSQADLYCGWRILDREVFLACWIVLFTLLGLYFLGKLKFKGDSDSKQIGVFRLFLAIITFTFVVYLVPGMWGAPLKALSGYIPPMTTQDFDIERLLLDNKTPVASMQEDVYKDVKYGKELHLPTGFQGFFDLEEAKAYARKVNKPVFIDFTGKTCPNCREMENRVWTDPKVRKLLTEEYIIVALYTDANTIYLPEEERVVNSKGKTLKRLGDKNLNYEIERYQMNAQPYYVLVDANEKILSRNGKGMGYEKDAQVFAQFLEEGLAEFHKDK